ncbi:hypothetical protein BZG25_09785 [Salinivibrio sp. ML198]|nr:hypothetical protein WN56_11945 [Salinivibrio sp. KP-1]MPS31340.1 hypothetical protein [Salinivibrio sp. VYel7]OOE51048.1 hypothetical protein BZG12_13045 [Salinivibrio kushneri]OOE65874.1 hypothetical protein BZG20_10800 [Salinivibrio sp. IB868]OOE74474.1 hypothetical protein BZG22_08275 [Salinivibrio sp. IB870]OOE79194.1 hypothetical protein BZG25_09785 [Salinivibrio sp. ML198]
MTYSHCFLERSLKGGTFEWYFTAEERGNVSAECHDLSYNCRGIYACRRTEFLMIYTKAFRLFIFLGQD